MPTSSRRGENRPYNLGRWWAADLVAVRRSVNEGRLNGGGGRTLMGARAQAMSLAGGNAGGPKASDGRGQGAGGSEGGEGGRKGRGRGGVVDEAVVDRVVVVAVGRRDPCRESGKQCSSESESWGGQAFLILMGYYFAGGGSGRSGSSGSGSSRRAGAKQQTGAESEDAVVRLVGVERRRVRVRAEPKQRRQQQQRLGGAGRSNSSNRETEEGCRWDLAGFGWIWLSSGPQADQPDRVGAQGARDAGLVPNGALLYGPLHHHPPQMTPPLPAPLLGAARASAVALSP